MTDNAERKVREWARDRNGDPLKNTDIVELVFAFADDQEADHNEVIERLDDVDERHISLCLRVAELEHTSIGCSERVKAFVAAEHDTRHTEHMSNHHGQDEEMGDLRRFWRTFKWAVIVFGTGLLIMLADQLGNVIFGGPT